MTDFEKFISQNIRTTTIFVMGGDWSEKTEIIRKVNGFTANALITYAYDWIKNETTITVRGV